MSKVIIIGGGPVGLSAAICLAYQGIESVLIEKHLPREAHRFTWIEDFRRLERLLLTCFLDCRLTTVAQ